MRRFTVMGFTEAELGFVLAALFAAMAVARVGDEDQRDATIEGLQQAAVERDSIAGEYDRYRDSMRVVLANAQARIEEAEKRSTKVPQCWEKGEQREPVAVLAVLGSDLFLLGDERLSLDGVRQRLAERLARADTLGCRFVVRAAPTGTVSSGDHTAAVWALRRYFDVDDRPS